MSLTVPLHLRLNASYIVQACNDFGCTDSVPVSVTGSLAEAVGYGKASNPDDQDAFGTAVSLSGDGRTLAVGTIRESSGAAGIDGNQADNSVTEAGAVYVFARDEQNEWSQQAYIKSSSPHAYQHFGCSVSLSEDGTTLAVGAYLEGSANLDVPGTGAAYVFVRDGQNAWSQQAHFQGFDSEPGDAFGGTVALSGDGVTLAVSASGESSSATGIDGNQADNSADGSGAAYVFTRDNQGVWSQQAYIKASNTEAYDGFGEKVALSWDGTTLAVSTIREDSNAMGIDGNQADNSADYAGAVYMFGRDDQGVWSQQAYIKASNTEADDLFGFRIAVSGDGATLAVGTHKEDSNATGIDGNQADNSAVSAGAAYVFTRDDQGVWSQQAYIKASNTDADDKFGVDVALSGDGSLLAVGAVEEASNDIGIGGEQADNSADDAGAVYVFTRDVNSVWSQEAYVKASNTAQIDLVRFVALSGDGTTLAVGAYGEDSSATGFGGNQLDNTVGGSGAVYLY
jgi:hypothetical protein